MQQTASHTSKLFKLNLERKTRTYTTEISTSITRDDKTTFNNIAEEFTITFIKTVGDLYVFRKQVQKRFFLNEINFVLKKLNKVQELALKTASINDNLEFHVNKHFQIVKVTNTNEIREKWGTLKLEVLEKHPDLKKMTEEFDEQLKEKYIQKMYLEDNFLTLLFSNLFHKEMNENKPIEENKLIANAMGEIDIPIIEKKVITKNRRLFSKSINIKTSAELDEENKKFPLAKLNNFIGELNTEIGTEHKLNFDYKGNYKVLPEMGLVSEAELVYTFEVESLYKKTSAFNFKLEENE